MKLLVVRHGAAMERDDFAHTGESDDLRPLTDEGKAEMKLIAARLRAAEVEKLDLLATSPLVRACQTAEIIAEAYGLGDPEIVDSLRPGGSFEEFVGWCESQGDKKVIAVVGHEPHLGTLVTWLLAGGNESHIRLKKGGVCLVEFDSQPQRGAGILNWLLTPRQLTSAAQPNAP
jgi:phosphohistidine phosphatase